MPPLISRLRAPTMFGIGVSNLYHNMKLPFIDPQAEDAPLIIFLHIAKTAGMSLNAMLFRQFQQKILAGSVPGATQSRSGMYRLPEVATFYASHSADRKKEFQACIGHNFFGLHKLIDRQCSYVSLIRDPIDRCISTYNYLLQTELIPRSTSFEEFVELELVICNSFQTRQICGSTSLDLTADFDPGTLMTKSSVTENRPVEMFDYIVARHNIQRHFLLCAPSERFDEVTLVLARIFGWAPKDVVQPKINVTDRTIQRNEIPAKLLTHLQHQNRYDEKLYRFVTARFDKLVKSLGVEFQHDLERLREHSAESSKQTSG